MLIHRIYQRSKPAHSEVRSSANRCWRAGGREWVCLLITLLVACPFNPWAILTGRVTAQDWNQFSADNHDPSAMAELAKRLQAEVDLELTSVLEAMQGRSTVARNWILSVAQTVADRDPARSQTELMQFLQRTSEDSMARYWAFSYVTRNDSQLREQLLESMLADPCLELRYESVELALKRLAEADTQSPQQKNDRYRELLSAARLPAQVQQIAQLLKEQEQTVNLLEHFGFVAKWQAVGPFDNINQSAFDTIYGPEEDAIAGVNLSTRLYAGKSSQQVGWRPLETTQDDGAVDLNAPFENSKGAIVYAMADFRCASELECEVRIGSPNACKVWVNGQSAISREVYHAGTQIDQYTAPVKLKAGSNWVLVKICQNEQTESWAQDWKFQLRFTDASGAAIERVQP
jgi:hypothetical protein